MEREAVPPTCPGPQMLVAPAAGLLVEREVFASNEN